MREVAERTRAQAEGARLQAIAAHGLPALRDEEAKAGAALHRLAIAREPLGSEEKRAEQRGAELQRRIVQLGRDLARETRSSRMLQASFCVSIRRRRRSRR